MILSSRQLEHFENYNISKMTRKEDSNYNSWRADDIIISYCKEVNFLGFKRYKIWTKTYSFKRNADTTTRPGYTSYTMDRACSELTDQLDSIIKDNIYYLSKEDYEYFKKNSPERFI